MTPPVYTVLRRRSLRRPAIILAVIFTVAFLARFMRDIVFDAQHSTRIAFTLAGGRSAETVTLTEWATRTVRLETPTPKPKPKETRLKDKPRPPVLPPLGKHTYRADGLLEVNPLGAHPIFELIERAEAAWAAKLAAASNSLRAAAAEYTRRYARLPPRGFDMWWAYATAHAVPLPDEYDQIDRDLAHFYGVAPADLCAIQRDWEAHADSYTIGKDAMHDGISMLNFTLPEDAEVRLELAAGAFQVIDLLKEVERDIPPFRAVFSPHDNPNLVTDYELKKQALDAAAAGHYIDVTDPTPQKHGWPAACPPLSPAQLDALPPPFDAAHPNTAPSSVPGSGAPKTFIHAHLPAMDPCLHPSHLAAHGQYLAHGAGPSPHRALIPQFSYSVTPLHGDIRAAMPLNWVPDDLPNEGRAPPLGYAWAERTDERLQWRGSNTGMWHAADGRWREAHRVRLAAFGAGRGAANVSVLRHGGERTRPVGAPREVPRARWVHALLDVAFAGTPLNADAGQSALLAALFEFRAPHDLRTAGRYKYVIDVDGNGWSSRFKRLMNSGSLIFKATAYPEWFTDRIAPWVHYIPIQTSYADLLDALVFFRGDPAGGGAHDDMARRIAGAGREWSRRYWRKEDLVAYMYRLFLEYARVMGADRAGMSFVMWPDVGDDVARERALMERWRKPQPESEEAEEDGWARS
ncbi:glycosyl transferase family 90-domain-containing protein [Mycena rosella]|uniref:Glycosyl transferase family 90-domain-containing protein n=1 Tax=Mycena rosella TaxID=1033263 RepID=A0AAD7GZ97_MYCRO|nr:glycosyl transferase family 90-domain-containing protein [Mycena rosella]